MKRRSLVRVSLPPLVQSRYVKNKIIIIKKKATDEDDYDILLNFGLRWEIPIIN
jgi:hypothetical protein